MQKKNDLKAQCGLGLSGMLAPDNYQNITLLTKGSAFIFLMEQESVKITDEENMSFVAELGKAPEGLPAYKWFLNYYLSLHDIQLESMIAIFITQDKVAYETFQYGNWLKYTSTGAGTDEVISIEVNTEKLNSAFLSLRSLTIADTIGEDGASGRVSILKNTGGIGIATATTSDFDGTLIYRPNGTLYFAGVYKNS